MQRQPTKIQLPIMYLDPGQSLTYTYVYADEWATFDRLRQEAEVNGTSLKLQYAYFDSERNKYFGVLVLDSTACREGLERVVESLKRQPGVEVVDVEHTGNGLAASEKHVLEVVGTPVVVFARAIIGATYRQLVETQGAQMEALLFRLGEAAGEMAASGVPALASTLGVTLDAQLLRERFHDLQVFGWGEVVSLQAAEDFSGEALLNDDFEAAAWQGQADSAKCHWLRGFITGALSTLRGRPFEVAEPECQAKGDAYCRMVFRPSPR